MGADAMENMKGYNNAVLKAKNRGQVFEKLLTNDGVSRTELAQQCGLTKMAISYIVNEFTEKHIVVETGKSEEKKPGRKSTYLHLSPSAKKVVGLLIHRNHISAALCDCQLHVLRARTIHFENCDRDSLLEMAFSLTDEMLEDNEVYGIGIGSIGPVEVEQGMILNPPDFYGIENIPIVQIFEDRYHLPVHLDYHYNCAARTEKYFGVGRKYKNFILLGIAGGVGISIVVDGKIFSRITGVSSELGHMTVDYQGKPCFCGRRGCLGGYIDFQTEESTWETIRILCTVLAGVCDLVLPQALVIRDEQSCLSEQHLEFMEQTLNRTIIAHRQTHFVVRKSSRSSELEAAGCAANVLGRIFGGEIPL